MRRFILGSMLVAGLTFSGGLAAQEAAREPAQEEILVQGTRDKDRDRQIGDFIAALTDAPVRGQISRFDWAVCPAAVGLAPLQNQAVADRMRRVAAAAGIPVADPKCAPNALVIVTPDKKAMIEQLNKLHPAYFSDMSDRQVRKLAQAPGPAAAWHVEGLLSSDGRALAKDVLEGYYVHSTTDSPSRVTASTRPHFVASVVVIELGALAGLSTTQLADYAALRAFAQTDPARMAKSRAPTILTILEQPMGSAVPVTLTQWDMSFLTALYAGSGNEYANHRRGQMKQVFKKDLEKSQQEEE